MPDLLLLSAIAAILATPGPTNTLLLTAGTETGFRRALRLVPAELAGYLVAITAWGLVLGRIAADRPWLALSLRLLSAAYLAWMAARLWRSARAQAEDPRTAVTVAGLFTTTVLNPKALVFAAGIFPATAFASLAGYLAAMGLFAATLVPIAVAWVGAGAATALTPGRPTQGLVQRGAAVVLLLFSASLGASALAG
jgi:threonine/homoserine/homoserine lactone efflux protein